MCGIAGLLRLGDAAEPDWTVVRRMTDAVAHRGPDDSGTWRNSRVALGHRRLSVIDLSPAGRQPMANEDDSIWMTYNGETYNFAELRSAFRLDERGHHFRSRTDTEVLIHLYEELGLGMLRHLNGMFAFALWDGRRGVLHLARDPYGVKPLFYHRDDQYLRFGSEIKAILADPLVPRRPSLQALHDYLTFDYIPGVQTAFEDIWEVPPGHCISVAIDGRAIGTTYCDPAAGAMSAADPPAVVDRCRALLTAAVRRQLVSDVPIGVLLSGGMDSSTITALMHECTTTPLHTYSVGFEDASFNELPSARLVAERFKTVHREVVVTPQRVRELLPTCVRFIDEPYADGSAIPTYCVCELARNDVVVVLSGEGGDEAFAGYDTYAAYQASRWFRRIPRWIRRALIAPLVHRLPVSHRKLSLEFRLKRFLAGQDLTPIQAHVWWRTVLREAEKLDLYSSWVREQIVPEESLRHFTEVFERSNAGDTLTRLTDADSAVFLPDDLMVKNDRMSMAHSLEARVPMTDPDLTAFMRSIPAGTKLPGLRQKYLMRRAMRDALPRAIVTKKKVGLEMPYSRWLVGDLRDLVRDHLGDNSVIDTRLFRPEAVRRLVDMHMAGTHDHGRALWGLLNYVVWMKLYEPRVGSATLQHPPSEFTGTVSC